MANTVHKRTTYRVRGIPQKWSGHDLRLSICDLFHYEIGDFEIHSLAHDAIPSSPTREKVATVTFVNIPNELKIKKTTHTWTFQTRPSSEHSSSQNDQSIVLIFDTTFLDFTPLTSYDIDDGTEIDFVLVHGWGGHPVGTFASPEDTYLWPRDDLPTRFPKLRVWLYGYESNPSNKDLMTDFHEHAVTLRRALRYARGDIRAQSPLRPLIFCVHSLGGLIFQHMVVDMAKSDAAHDTANLHSLVGALYFGVPNQGMRVDEMRSLVQNLPSRGTTILLDKDLGFRMREKHAEEFRRAFPKSDNIYLFFEELKSLTIREDESTKSWVRDGPPALLVNAESATSGGYLYDNKISLQKHHTNMLKFYRGDIQYRRVWDPLSKLQEAALRPTPSSISQKLKVPKMSVDMNSESIQVHYGTKKLKIQFMRTIRVPDNSTTFELPPVLGHFPLRRVSKYASTIPIHMAQKGGVFFPMYKNEAMWIRFDSSAIFAIKIFTGEVNTISSELIGNEWNERLHKLQKLRQLRKLQAHENIQDYIVTPKQKRVDGIAVMDGIVRQFVATPVGSNYSIEMQVKGEEGIAGLRFEIIPAKLVWERERLVDPSTFLYPVYIRLVGGDIITLDIQSDCTVSELKKKLEEQENFLFDQQRILYRTKILADDCTLSSYGISKNSTMHLVFALRGGGRGSREMTIAAGGLIRQVIHEDSLNSNLWADVRPLSLSVQIVNAESFRNITGRNPPQRPLSAKDYAKAGLPFYKVVERTSGIFGSFAVIKSIAQINAQKLSSVFRLTSDRSIIFPVIVLHSSCLRRFRPAEVLRAELLREQADLEAYEENGSVENLGYRSMEGISQAGAANRKIRSTWIRRITGVRWGNKQQNNTDNVQSGLQEDIPFMRGALPLETASISEVVSSSVSDESGAPIPSVASLTIDRSQFAAGSADVAL